MTGTPPVPDDWIQLALEPPRASGTPVVRGRLRARPEDFRVDERLGFEPDGGAAHRLLQVEKTDANTLFVARSLARAAGVRPADVGFSGLKDRRAVARQWFSVPAGREEPDWAGFTGPGFRVREAWPHSRKLRRGVLASNRFEIIVRDLEGDLDALGARLAGIAGLGAPNYFGPQRFGREAGNLAAVARWAAGTPLPREREQRAFVLSSARALLFNAVLAERVNRADWERILPGEVVNLAGSASVFAAEDPDATLEERCRRLDVHPTGPLVGTGGLSPRSEALAVERAALEPLAPLERALETAGLDAARRALRVTVAGLEGSVTGDVLTVAFELGRGAFATAVLRELLDFAADGLPGSDD